MTTRVFFVLLWTLICLPACKKDRIPDEEDPEIPLVFQSLTAGRSVIFTEDTTALKAQATGYMLQYHWYVDKGDLLGSGNKITFVATPCTVGDNIVSCTVKDGYGNEEEKYVTVTVL